MKGIQTNKCPSTLSLSLSDILCKDDTDSVRSHQG